MARKVFFSFHYQDVIDFRANVVRNHWLTKSDREDAGFFDSSVWETAKKSDTSAVKRLIHSGLDGTSVTCVLIGTQTYTRPWVRYELMKSFRKGNRILGVYINLIRGAGRANEVVRPKPIGLLGNYIFRQRRHGYPA